jgi:hypothetical protein
LRRVTRLMIVSRFTIVSWFTMVTRWSICLRWLLRPFLPNIAPAMPTPVVMTSKARNGIGLNASTKVNQLRYTAE